LSSSYSFLTVVASTVLKHPCDYSREVGFAGVTFLRAKLYSYPPC
jgi:hypothetical protein